MKINKKILAKYSDEQLKQWKKDNGLTEGQYKDAMIEAGLMEAPEEKKEALAAEEVVGKPGAAAKGAKPNESK